MGAQPGGQGTRPADYAAPRTRSRGPFIAGLLVLAVAAAAVTAFLLTRNHGTTPPAANNGQHTQTTGPSTPPSQTPSSPPPSSPPPPAVLGPAGTVKAYIAAINAHHYRRAWNLGGKFTTSSFATYKAGFATTQHDTLTILGVSGNVVTARLSALQTDGITKVFQGTYTVENGVITHSSIRQIS
jgi:hypothetical protein